MSDTIDTRWMTVDPSPSVPENSELLWCPADPDDVPVSAQDEDGYATGALPWEDIGGALPLVAGAFALPPFLEMLRQKGAALAKQFEGQAIGYLAKKLDAIPGKPSYENEATVRQFDPLVHMRVQQAWEELTRKQKAAFHAQELPGEKITRAKLEHPSPAWTTAAARAVLAEAELAHDAGQLSEEAAGFERLAADFEKLGLFQRAADFSLEAARLHEQVSDLGSAAFRAYVQTSLMAKEAGNVAQAADAMREAQRIRVAAAIAAELRKDSAVGAMELGTGELQGRFARLVARAILEEPELLERFVEFPLAPRDEIPMPFLREDWRKAAERFLKEGGAALFDHARAGAVVPAGGTAADRLALEQIVRFAKRDAELRNLMGRLSDGALRRTCEELYREWKGYSPEQQHAVQLREMIREGRVQSIGRMAVAWLREEVRRRHATLAAQNGDARAWGAKEKGVVDRKAGMPKATRIMKGGK